MLDLPAPQGGDVLAQPTRSRLFALLSELRRPAGTAELAEKLNLHPNGVRMHLERMERAGLLVRARRRTPRGRPPDAWAIAPDAQPAGRAPSAYHDLGRWLARAMGERRSGVRAIEATGRQIGMELAPDDHAEPAHAFHDALASLGFQPTVAKDAGGGLSLCLENCPYRDAVRENREAICALHRGMTRGLLDAIAPHARLLAFVPRDPEKAGCVIELSGLPRGAIRA